MAIFEHKVGEAAQDNANAAIGGVMLTSRNLQAIAMEFAKMSFDSVDHATQVLDRFSKAKSWDQIIDIQTVFFKSSIDSLAGHGARMAELMAVWPNEMGKSYREASGRMLQVGTDTAKAAVDQGSAAAQKVAAAGDQAQEAASSYTGH